MSLLRCQLVVLLLACAIGAQAARGDEADRQRRNTEFPQRFLPLVERYCLDCHHPDDPKGDAALAPFASPTAMLEEREVWLRALPKLVNREMPPADADQPTADERKYLIDFIDGAIHDIDCVTHADPGRVTIRRLTRIEYRNSLRQLLGVDYQPADNFPADDVGYGFDNIADVLTLPPILLEKYLAAAEEITERALPAAALPLVDRVVEAADLRSSTAGSPDRNGGRTLSSNGEFTADINAPQSGAYRLRVLAAGDQAGDEPVKLAVRVDGQQVAVIDVPAERNRPGLYSVDVRLELGRRRVGLAFINDYYRPDDPNPRNRDRNLVLHRVEVRGPAVDRAKQPESFQRIFFVRPEGDVSRDDAARQLIEHWGLRLFRRPLASAERDRLLRLVALAQREGDSFEKGVQLALQAMLISPHFLYKIELDPTGPNAPEVRALNDFELATRLSYFLWSSTPDDELLRAAADKRLTEPAELERQTRRMLADKKAASLIDNFAVQWLELRRLEDVQPDPNQFRAFSDALRADMRRETELLWARVVREDRSLLELLTADYTYVNQRLARLYGLPNVTGDNFQLVSLADTPRRGLLGHASILTITSNPTRTSPVKRGKWVLENLLGEPPPPPAPDVPELDDQQLSGTLRQQMEQHRVNPACAACHSRMDPLGFALENFDAIGAWRERDAGAPIDPSGELPTGERFAGPRELSQVLIDTKRAAFVRCLTEKMLIYAVGRGLDFPDVCAVNEITAKLAQNDYRFSTLVLEIVRSDPFQKRSTKRSPS